MKSATKTALLLAVSLAAIGNVAAAKDVLMTPGWSGIWADQNGQHRCSIQLADATDPTRLTVLCQLGATSASADLSPAPAYGELVPLTHNRASFGATAADPAPWGDLLWFAVCDRGQPSIFAYGFGNTTTVTFWLRPVNVPAQRSICQSRN